MTVVGRFLRDRRRAIGWWTFGIVATVVVTMAVFPSMQGEPSLDEAFADLPESMKVAFGIADGVSLTSPAGYLQSQLLAATLPVILLVLGIAAGARVVAGPEEAGQFELLLAQPVTRRRLLLLRTAAALLELLAVSATSGLAVVASAVAFGATEGVDRWGLLASLASVTALVLLHAAIALAVGAWTGRRAPAVAAAAAVAVAGYLLHALGSATAALDGVVGISPWNWFLAENLLVTGPSALPLLAPLGLAAAAVAVAVRGFERRDVG